MHYLKLCQTYEQLESTTKRLEKIFIISNLLKETEDEDLSEIILLMQGKVFPPWDERKIGFASKMAIKAISQATGISILRIEEEFNKIGDLGLVAQHLIKTKRQATLLTQKLTVKKVFKNIQKLSELEGVGTVAQKINLVVELLTNAKPIEAKYIIRTLLEEMRVGIGEGSIRDAIVWAFFGKGRWYYDKEKNNIIFSNESSREHYNEIIKKVEHAFDMSADFVEIIKAAKKGLKSLEKFKIVLGKPIKVMLYQKVKDIQEAFEVVGKPCAFEYKFDGFRMQIHKYDSKIKIFTRRLDDVTLQFPEVVEYVKKYVEGREFILDSEAVGYDKKTAKYLQFQNISQRIKRKYNIKEMSKNYPVEINVFDIIYYNGKELIKEPFKKRRALIEKIIKQKEKAIVCAKQIVTDDIQKAQQFYQESLKKGNEGIMAKKLDAIYKPGMRVGYGVKLKPTMEPLDLVIIGAQWGEGKRAKWLTSYEIACQDKNGNLLAIGKVGTGFKELEGSGVSFEDMTKLLKPLIISTKAKTVKVKPKIIIEVMYEEIQKSPKYKSGYALRFPRLKVLREDKSIDDISTLDIIEKLYKSQLKTN